MTSRDLARARERIVLLAIALAAIGAGPCGPLPGGRLSGEEATAPVEDWSFANDAGRCAVEVRPESPHSVTVNCMSWQRRLFVSCSECAPKRWSGYALQSPQGRVRIADRVHPVLLRRIEDPGELDEIWRARAHKLGNEEPEPRPEGWWTFELRSR